MERYIKDVIAQHVINTFNYSQLLEWYLKGDYHKCISIKKSDLTIKNGIDLPSLEHINSVKSDYQGAYFDLDKKIIVIEYGYEDYHRRDTRIYDRIEVKCDNAYEFIMTTLLDTRIEFEIKRYEEYLKDKQLKEVKSWLSSDSISV